MRPDAEAHKQELRPLSEQDGPAFKIERDPRLTPFGSLLRKTSIDELPQLWNVVKGDMSLVGPRPLPVDETDACLSWHRRRLDITPGLTCIWQVKGRSRVTFDEWVRMDVAYMRRRTLIHDLWLLLITIPAVLLRRGAR
jgi:lipopolysaccharide/colanic/teichoic acid biosynthesis glycosyltransferase